MTPKGWDAGHELSALRERMSRLFEEELSARAWGSAAVRSPRPTDIYLTEDRVVVTVETARGRAGGHRGQVRRAGC